MIDLLINHKYIKMLLQVGFVCRAMNKKYVHRMGYSGAHTKYTIIKKATKNNF